MRDHAASNSAYLDGIMPIATKNNDCSAHVKACTWCVYKSVQTVSLGAYNLMLFVCMVTKRPSDPDIKNKSELKCTQDGGSPRTPISVAGQIRKHLTGYSYSLTVGWLYSSSSGILLAASVTIYNMHAVRICV